VRVTARLPLPACHLPGFYLQPACGMAACLLPLLLLVLPATTHWISATACCWRRLPGTCLPLPSITTACISSPLGGLYHCLYWEGLPAHFSLTTFLATWICSMGAAYALIPPAY